MKQLYLNELYNAIQAGLHNALVLDGDDLPINYNKSDINANYSHLLTVDELIEIFNIDNNKIFSDLTKYNLSFILNNNIEIPICEYDIHKHPMAIFLKMTFPELIDGNNEILIKLQHLDFLNYVKWQTVYEQILPNIPDYEMARNKSVDIACSDYSGWQNTQDILKISQSNHSKYGHTEAAEHCNRCLIRLNGNTEYKGFLPALGQLNIVFKCFDILLYILWNFQWSSDWRKLGRFFIWTSTEHSAKDAWGIFGNSHNIYAMSKSANTVIPFYKKLSVK